MRKPASSLSLFTKFTVATCLFFAGLTASANAQFTEGLYIGFNIVPVSYRTPTSGDFATENALFTRLGYGAAALATEASSSGTLLTVGKTLNEKLAIELGIKDYGERKTAYAAVSAAGNTATAINTVSVSSLLIQAKYNLKQLEKFSLYGKGGLESWNVDDKTSTTTNDTLRVRAASTDASDSGLALAVAVGVDFPTKFGVLQVEIAPRNFENKAGKEILSSTLNIGYHYKF